MICRVNLLSRFGVYTTGHRSKSELSELVQMIFFRINYKHWYGSKTIAGLHNTDNTIEHGAHNNVRSESLIVTRICRSHVDIRSVIKRIMNNYYYYFYNNRQFIRQH